MSLSKLIDAATPGPWIHLEAEDDEGRKYWCLADKDESGFGHIGEIDYKKANSELICFLVNNASAFNNLIAAAENMLDAARGVFIENNLEWNSLSSASEDLENSLIPFGEKDGS